MANYDIFIDINPESHYQVSIIPSGRGGGALAAKHYSSRDLFIADLKNRIGFSAAAIDRLFSDPKGRGTLTEFSLSDENARYFGWQI